MQFYLVWVSSPQFKSSKPLTYSFKGYLKNGSIVKVPFKNQHIIGLVDSSTSKPAFSTKEIDAQIISKPLPGSTLELLKWLMSYYPASSASQLQLFLPTNLLKLKDTEIVSEPSISTEDIKLPALTDEQKSVLRDIAKYSGRTILLHGDTSSGKTRVYIELITKVMARGKSAIILTPEIGLTPQVLMALEQSFPKQVTLIHSSLTDKVRRDSWLNIIQNKKPQIIVGPRSALFSPIENLGLIVMDEAHEASYKQEQSPYYQSTRVAAKLAEISNATLVLGTATPLISDYYVFKAKDLLTVRMTKSAVDSGFSSEKFINTVELTDRSNFSRANWLSNQLIDSITKSLANGEQSIVFLNRRGTAQVILCQKCGWQALCPNCDTSLTYHGDSHSMLCHSCSYSQVIPSNCPICKSPDIVFRGTGTKAITEELSKIFKTARISRFDKDNKKSESLERNYNELLTGNIDIAVGTQIITKGLDLPKLSTVGIIMADSGLFFPDYMAEERTFQNLMQVIGRVGRGHISGRVIVQTYHPESTAIKSAVDRSFIEFYEQQLIERKKYQFPPFVFLLKISAKRATRKTSLEACTKLVTQINELELPIIINGPAPAFHEKQNGKYIWQLVIKSTNRAHLLKIIEHLPANFSYDIDPVSLL